MKKKYFAIALLFMFMYISVPKALILGNCKVLASFKLNSNLDEEKYICKGNNFGTSDDKIYYTSNDDIIHLNGFNTYYFKIWDEYELSFEISNQNSISFFQVNNSKFNVSGKGSLKFKQNSFVKKLKNGESVYNYVYNGKLLLDSNKKLFEGTLNELKSNYDVLRSYNEIPIEYTEDNFKLLSTMDYSKMTSVIVNDNWLYNHVNTSLNMSVEDGFAVIKYIDQETLKKEEKEEVSNITQLEADNVILIADLEPEINYELKETSIKDEEISSKVSMETDKSLISFYDVSVYDGETEVLMKDGKYTIKIKLEDDFELYEDYQIIYVNDENEIEEYIIGTIIGNYIVFETTHLSQYGVIAKPKASTINIKIFGKSRLFSSIKFGFVLKISIIVIFIICACSLIGIIYFKSNLKNNRRKRA